MVFPNPLFDDCLKLGEGVSGVMLLIIVYFKSHIESLVSTNVDFAIILSLKGQILYTHLSSCDVKRLLSLKRNPHLLH